MKRKTIEEMIEFYIIRVQPEKSIPTMVWLRNERTSRELLQRFQKLYDSSTRRMSPFFLSTEIISELKNIYPTLLKRGLATPTRV